VNFYSKADPLLAVGSVAQASMPSHYVWRCYLDHQAAGIAADISIAEAQLRIAIARDQDLTPGLI
jgi:hypothetical protein